VSGPSGLEDQALQDTARGMICLKWQTAWLPEVWSRADERGGRLHRV
jgi:hypothetical protein